MVRSLGWSKLLFNIWISKRLEAGIANEAVFRSLPCAQGNSRKAGA